MTRNNVMLVLLLTAALAPTARADEPAPTKEQLALAKQAFEEGNALYKAGKLAEAIDKLKESYRLSRNAFLLYNIGHTYDQLGQHDMVLFYYRKFLAAAPASAPMRDSVAKRVAALEQENVQESTPEPEDAVVEPAPASAEPASKYSAADFAHEPVFTSPPGMPIDVTARVPQDSELTVKLFYRSAGEATFVSKPMTWRNIELVARIPAARVNGGSVQYYLEVRGPDDKLVTRSGKSTSPHLVHLEPGATPQYYADFVDEGGEVFVPPSPDETPLAQGPEGRGIGLRAAKWTATGVASGLLVTSVISYVLAGQQSDKLRMDSRECGVPPCRDFDAEFGHKVEALGQRYDTIYKWTLGIGVATAAVAGFLWYRDRAPRVSITPELGGGYTGATAVVRF
jgi:hypothetical protein